MSLAQPIRMSRGAWTALRDGLVEPAWAGARDGALLGVTRLSAAWGAAQLEGDGATVFLTAEDAAALAELLDAHPELAALLAG